MKVNVKGKQIEHNPEQVYLFPDSDMGTGKIVSIFPINMGKLLENYPNHFGKKIDPYLKAILGNCNKYLEMDEESRRKIPINQRLIPMEECRNAPGSEEIVSCLEKEGDRVKDYRLEGVRRTKEILERLVN